MFQTSAGFFVDEDRLFVEQAKVIHYVGMEEGEGGGVVGLTGDRN